jgi:hypothetical protein
MKKQTDRQSTQTETETETETGQTMVYGVHSWIFVELWNFIEMRNSLPQSSGGQTSLKLVSITIHTPRLNPFHAVRVLRIKTTGSARLEAASAARVGGGAIGPRLARALRAISSTTLP